MTHIIEGHEAVAELERMGDSIYRRWWKTRGATKQHWMYERATHLWKRAKELKARLKEEKNVQSMRASEPVVLDWADDSSDQDASQVG